MTSTALTRPNRATFGGIVVAGLIGGGVAAVANVVLFFILGALGTPFDIPMGGPGAPLQPLSPVQIAIVCILPGLLAGLLYAGLLRFVLLNVLLAVFNLLPVPPLDGGNILAGLVPERIALAIDRLRPWGFLLLYALMLSGLLAEIIFPVQRAVLAWLL